MNSATFKLYVNDIDYLKTLFLSNDYDEVLASLHLPFEAFYDVLKNSTFQDTFDKSKCFLLVSDFYHYDFEKETKTLIDDQYILCTLDTFDNFKCYKEFYFFLESFLKEKGYEI